MALNEVYDYFRHYDKETYQVVACMGLHALGFEDYIPFLSVIGDGDVIFCFDKDNHIVALDWYNSGETEELNCDFSGLLLQQIAELEERKNEMINMLKEG